MAWYHSSFVPHSHRVYSMSFFEVLRAVILLTVKTLSIYLRTRFSVGAARILHQNFTNFTAEFSLHQAIKKQPISSSNNINHYIAEPAVKTNLPSTGYLQRCHCLGPPWTFQPRIPPRLWCANFAHTSHTLPTYPTLMGSWTFNYRSGLILLRHCTRSQPHLL